MGFGGYSAYKQTDVITADPMRLVIMCYEEAIRSLNLAVLLYSSKNYEAKGKAVQKSLDIIAELREALDFERGGSIATSLNTLYGFMIGHIIRSDQTKNVKGLHQVVAMLEQLKSAWEKVVLGRSEESSAEIQDLDLGLRVSGGGWSTQAAGYLK